jgi:hypothetical protein
MKDLNDLASLESELLDDSPGVVHLHEAEASC